MEESIIEAAKSYIRDVFQSDHGRHAFLKGFLKELEEENINIHSDHGSDPIRL